MVSRLVAQIIASSICDDERQELADKRQAGSGKRDGRHGAAGGQKAAGGKHGAVGLPARLAEASTAQDAKSPHRSGLLG